MKKFGNHVYYEENKLYLINYDNSDVETMKIKEVQTYKCLDQDKDIMRRITRLSTELCQANVIREMKKQNTTSKLPAQFLNVVYDNGTANARLQEAY